MAAAPLSMSAALVAVRSLGLVRVVQRVLMRCVAPRRGFVAAFFTAWGVFSPMKSMTFPPAATAVHSPPASG